MTKQNQLNTDLKAAMIAKTQTVVDVLRQLKNALSNTALLSGNINNPVSDSDVLSAIRKAIKQRQDAILLYVQGNRPELAEKEQEEIEVLEKYLPVAMTEAELDLLITITIADIGAVSKKDMGKVIKRVVELAQGRADNKTISAKVGQLIK